MKGKQYRSLEKPMQDRPGVSDLTHLLVVPVAFLPMLRAEQTTTNRWFST